MKRGFWLCLAMGAVGGGQLSFAGPLDWSSTETCFQSGRFEGLAGQTLMFSPALGASRPPVDYTCTEIAMGYMLTDPHGKSVLRGNLEVIGSLFAGGIFDGRGHYVTGTTGWIRYHFLLPGCRFVPYLAAGPGLTETDVDRRIEGRNFNFNLNLAAGTRYLLSGDCS